MREVVSADDFFQVQKVLKKKKKRKQREYHQEHENGEGESEENAELGCASPLLFDERAAQRVEGLKKKKKHKTKGQKKQSLLDHFYAGEETEISDETGVGVARKKKKKPKCSENTDDQSEEPGVPEHQQSDESCLEVDCVYFKQSAKKKRKAKWPENDEEHELPASETGDKNDLQRPKKKRRRKKRGSSSQEVQEDTDVTVAELLVSSPEQSRQKEDPALASPAEEGGAASSQRWQEDGDTDDFLVISEDSVDGPAHFSKPTKAADGSHQKTPARARKPTKSSVLVMEGSSSECEVMISEPLASEERKDQNSSFTEMADSDELTVGDDEILNSTVCSATGLDTARQELEEFIPHVRNISDSSIRKMAGRDLMRFKEFKKQGVAVKFGRFSQKENDQIRKNVEDFLSITGIDSAEKLLFTSRYPEDKEAINRLKAEHLFCEKLSEGIPRPWRLIYYRARKMFDPNNYKGRYTKEEKEKLKKYHALHGNDWKKIAEMMSRSNLSVAMKYSEIKSAINYGPWSREETQKLMHAVEEVIRKRLEGEESNSLSSSGKSNRDLSIDREKLCQTLPWTEIEAKVGTRYWRQCKQKWTTILTNKMTKGQQVYRGTKGLQAKINLIKRLYEMKVEDANEVNWEELSNIIGDVPRAYVQAKFYKLKVSCVPFWQKKTFSEIIDYLFEEKLPEFEEMLEKRKQKQFSSDKLTASQQRTTFQLSDIFDSSEDSD
ncbi:transcription termination factor 1 [Apus apus]|uniref:transcription termination factor 1 n=1 Tax=Apus apus TaxID=8895 RepID=UPI0021F8BBEE|nr:transcription termination factor 1 [Apus apus]XP_051492701.1 transcription termination factor 1 [Apus apus]XP_051492702.1 transcription termination factor 1 [Apus apus]XP_051492703.1 transcription termination factor 1 [Apus apus]XP_051492704.1 transcription termination factor 1 [Apus apus]XP_051492705.1 transcription termination factor 1 [Apus apus]XP_051492706.1 transcription termination factor 1 [Apus apus]XP_051492707.1 transcription termination factor 1 [Apus apus]XP_051492708.1 tran